MKTAVVFLVAMIVLMGLKIAEVESRNQWQAKALNRQSYGVGACLDHVDHLSEAQLSRLYEAVK